MENSVLIQTRQRLLRTHWRLVSLQGLLGLTLFLAAAFGGLPNNPVWAAMLGMAVLAGVAGEHHILKRKTTLWDAERASLQALQKDLLASRDEVEAGHAREQLQFREAERALATIRSSSQNLVLVGEDLHIRLINLSMLRTLQARLEESPALQATISEALAGGHCDCLSGPMDPPLSERLGALTGATRWDVAYGALMLRISATRVEDSNGQFLGYAMEWRDRTEDLAIQAEIADLVHRAAGGMLDGRLPLDDKQGFNRQVSEGINQLLANCRSGMQEVASALALLAEGRLEVAEGAALDGMFGDMQRHTRDTVRRLIDIVRHIHEGTELIQSAVHEISRGMADLAQRTDTQAREIEGTAASMEQLTTTVRQNGDNAQQANQLALRATQIANRGGGVMDQVVTSMVSIRDTSRRIGDILGVIDSIAFQTNILAVNASVEAARAGEHGRGFAVVAAEVGKLSQRSAQAAREIRILMTETEERVRTGADQVTSARATMHDIVAAVGHVATIMLEITDASAQQTLGINFINEAIAHMDSVTQQNASLVEEAAVATESLDQQARILAEAVALFSIEGRPLTVQAPQALTAMPPGSQAAMADLRRRRDDPAAAQGADRNGQPAKFADTNSQFTRFQNAAT